MEESIKRKERLKAMRTEASQLGVCDDDGRNSLVESQSFANPLIEAHSPSTMRSEPLSVSRFDYYTNPMAAFSDKSRGKVSHQISLNYSNPPTGPGNQEVIFSQPYSSPDLSFPYHGPHYSPGAFGSPIRMPSPYNAPHGTPGMYNTPHGVPSPYNTPHGTPSPYNTPHATTSPYNTPRGIPSPYNSADGSINHLGISGQSSPSFSPSNPSYGFGQGGRPRFISGQSRGYMYNNSPQPGSGVRGSPYHNSGRGRRGSWVGSASPGYAQSGSRNDVVSAELRPDSYYKRSMVEDPWKKLKPVVWRLTNLSLSSDNQARSNSWLPNSITSKKARVSGTSNQYKSEQSLAEYLAASFNEAATDETKDSDATPTV